MTYTRYRMIRKTSEYVFADISVESELMKINLCERSLKLALMSAMRTMFGETGMAIPIDVIKFDQSSNRALIRFPGKDYVKVHCALTFLSSWDGVNISIIFLKVANSLSALSIESSRQVHNIVCSL